MIMSPINTVTFNGTNLYDFGVYVSGNQTYSSAERDYEEIEIPGRSGSLFIDNKRYKNKKHPYDAWIGENLEENLRNLRAFLGSSPGYCRLEDTYHPDEFYSAIYRGPLDVETILLTAGTFTLDFERKPYRFLKSGETVQTFTADGSITNPTLFSSNPLIRVYGSGTLIVNGFSIEVLPHSTVPFIDIDSDVKDNYCYQTNCNNMVKMGTTFPTLAPGVNQIIVGSGITQAEITPRWWTL